MAGGDVAVCDWFVRVVDVRRTIYIYIYALQDDCVMYMLDEDMFLEMICSDSVHWYIRDVDCKI